MSMIFKETKSASNWQWVRCQDVVDVRDGTHDTPTKRTSGIPLITSKNLTLEGLDFGDVTYISEEDYQSIEKRSAVDDGDILFAMIGTIGTPVLVKKDRLFSIKNVALFKLDKSLYYPPFFKELLNSPSVESQLARNTRGGNQKFVSLSVLREMIVPLPPLEEQKRIAEILDRAESLRAMRRQSIEQLNTLIESIFFEMFDRSTNDFDITTIGEIASKSKYGLSSGPFGSNLTSKHYVDEGIIVLRGLNITSNRLNLENLKFISEEKAKELARSEVKPGDIVVVAVGFSGLAYQIPDSLPRAIMSQNFNKISPDLQKVTATYLTFCINSSIVQNQIDQQITDTVRTFLSLTKLKTVKIPLPPLDLQQKFTQRVNVIEKLKTTHQKSLIELDALFASLQHRAFRGEL
jgi:type I restriction enzyme, S subunit